MKKNEKGILAVETSIVLTFCVMLMLFLFSFARVYSAQSLVGHAVIQACDAVAMESYVREVSFNESEEDVVVLANRITGAASLSNEKVIANPGIVSPVVLMISMDFKNENGVIPESFPALQRPSA